MYHDNTFRVKRLPHFMNVVSMMAPIRRNP
jgi:hypothetical protein